MGPRAAAAAEVSRPQHFVSSQAGRRGGRAARGGGGGGGGAARARQSPPGRARAGPHVTAAGQWEAGGALWRLRSRPRKFKLRPSGSRSLGAQRGAWWREGRWRRGVAPGTARRLPRLGARWRGLRGRARGWREGAGRPEVSGAGSRRRPHPAVQGNSNVNVQSSDPRNSRRPGGPCNLLPAGRAGLATPSGGPAAGGPRNGRRCLRCRTRCALLLSGGTCIRTSSCPAQVRVSAS